MLSLINDYLQDKDDILVNLTAENKKKFRRYKHYINYQNVMIKTWYNNVTNLFWNIPEIPLNFKFPKALKKIVFHNKI